MVNIETFRISDLKFGLGLCQDAGWNQTPMDWRRFLHLSPDGCFIARVGQRSVGTVTTCQFEEVGWIGMMLVDPAWRRQGIGRALMSRAMEHLAVSGATSVRLDATQYGEPLYASLGFVRQFRLRRFAGRAMCGQPTAAPAPASDDDRARIVALDRRIVGYDRSRLLAQLWPSAVDSYRVGRTDAGVAGYILRRSGARAMFVGPCIAASATLGQDLLRQMIRQCGGHDVFVDVPDDNQAAVATVTAEGLVPVREFQRMVHGDPRVEQLDGLFASSGPETG